MPMITEEEYSFLISLDDKWKWLARNKNGELYLFTKEPIKPTYFFVSWTNAKRSDMEFISDEKLFSFVKWSDDKATFIYDLIYDYKKYSTSIKEFELTWPVIARPIQENDQPDEAPEARSVEKEIYGKRIYKDSNVDDDFKRVKDSLNKFGNKNKEYRKNFVESLDQDGLFALKIRLGDKYSRMSDLLDEGKAIDHRPVKLLLEDLLEDVMLSIDYIMEKEEKGYEDE